MLTGIEVQNRNSEILHLPLGDSSSGFHVQGIDGLDPVQATIVSSSFANKDGEEYQTSRREKRNILISLGFDPDYSSSSVRSLRQRLYKYFMPKTDVRLRFFDSDDPSVDIRGWIETFESPLFTPNPEAKISILCLNPDFYSNSVITVPGSTVSTSSEFNLNYGGTVDTGVIFEMNFNRDADGIAIYNRRVNGVVTTLELDYQFLNGDKLFVNTNVGNKSITLTRDNVEISILYSKTMVSSWINLYPGSNFIRVYSEGAAIPYTIKYNNKFGGL